MYVTFLRKEYVILQSIIFNVVFDMYDFIKCKLHLQLLSEIERSWEITTARPNDSNKSHVWVLLSIQHLWKEHNSTIGTRPLWSLLSCVCASSRHRIVVSLILSRQRDDCDSDENCDVRQSHAIQREITVRNIYVKLHVKPNFSAVL